MRGVARDKRHVDVVVETEIDAFVGHMREVTVEYAENRLAVWCLICPCLRDENLFMKLLKKLSVNPAIW